MPPTTAILGYVAREQYVGMDSPLEVKSFCPANWDQFIIGFPLFDLAESSKLEAGALGRGSHCFGSERTEPRLNLIAQAEVYLKHAGESAKSDYT